ncbi:hypothetical protein BOTCAL_0320g00140 [Botryotinia calthae]|uniref:NodB homology domain-containing protein n=1 Tax=Botryotinia calthae TaxID=38488 RepID=A0A4Y8CTR4_9HELO|nr:hypothetical protein BOTCAL_0320g00140 [Botryotinia calthae]
MHLLQITLVVLLGFISTTSARFSKVPTFPRAISPNNTCGFNGTAGGVADGYTCPSSLPCCSSNGFCGKTDAYCLSSNGCQSQFGNCTSPVAVAGSKVVVSPDETCGIIGAGTQGYSCPNGECCSNNGWCGTSSDYCSATSGCQSTFGICNNATNTTTPGSKAGTSTDTRCGPGVGTCASDQCCSLAGYCGTTEEYCTAPDCQFNYGPACDANAIPTGANTSTIARPAVGSVLYGSDGIYDCATPGDMALTFDDGPYIYTSHILDLLAQYNASATFFITGNNNGKGHIDNTSLEWPALIKRMYDNGHQVASHTWSHPDLCNITSAQRKNEMWKNEMALRNVIGVIPTYMRPPYSSCTAECGCEADMQELGYHVTYFSLDTQDYLNDSPTLIHNAQTIFSNTLNASNPRTDHPLVISHDIHNQTSQVLVEYMLKTAVAKGYRPVTVGTCLGVEKANWYRTDTATSLG